MGCENGQSGNPARPVRAACRRPRVLLDRPKQALVKARLYRFTRQLSLPAFWPFLLLLAGCAPFTDAYPGPFRSANEVAIVTGRAALIGQPGYEDLFINSVDGERAIGGWKAPTQEVQILPGSHIIGVVEARLIEAGESEPLLDRIFSFGTESDDVFKDQARLGLKVIVGARYALGYNPATKEFTVIRVGLGPVPFDLVK